MRLIQLTVLKVPEEIQAVTGFAVRIFVAIEEAPVLGIPMTAELGGQTVEAFGVVQSIEPVLSGYLKNPPDIGDELVIKIGELSIPTGLTVENPPIFA